MGGASTRNTESASGTRVIPDAPEERVKTQRQETQIISKEPRREKKSRGKPWEKPGAAVREPQQSQLLSRGQPRQVQSTGIGCPGQRRLTAAAQK